MVPGLIDRINRSLLPVALAFVGGIGTASRAALPAPAVLAAMALLATILLWAYFSGRPRLASLLLIPCFFLTGFWHGAPVFEHPKERHHVANVLDRERQDVVLAGVLAEVPARANER
ncbi:MAG TPA: hypothetical protein VLL73_00385, partial [Desulfurivibrionaceae bacterium]|nr:hypothetical protein [Desulfurivibrionaceae bacterium]